MSRANEREPLIQQKRRDAIARLISEIDHGEIPSIDRHGARFIFQQHILEADPAACAICGVPLIGRQQHFCSGHWDYVVVDLPLDQPYHRLLTSLAAWLRENLSEPQITWHYHYWLGVAKGMYKCEVCECTTGHQEVLGSDSERAVKRHAVCEDHASFRLPDDEHG